MKNGQAVHGQGLAYSERVGAVCCDVLDAWFDPSAAAVAAYRPEPGLLRASPETDGFRLIHAISEARGIDSAAISLGAGSSEIIHRVLPTLMGSDVLLLDPTYSEYAHVIDRAGGSVMRFSLREDSGFGIDLQLLREASAGVSAVILVNPNNPTGRRLTREEVLNLRRSMSQHAVLWVDEAYVDYCPDGTSVERDATSTPGLIVVKSLSKAYALSGVRAAYLVAAPSLKSKISAGVPPWIVGGAAMDAAIAALQDPGYYRCRWVETHDLVGGYASMIRDLGYRVWAGWINAVLIQCPAGVTADAWAAELASRGVIVRTPSGMGEVLGDRFIRIGLVEKDQWGRVAEALGKSRITDLILNR